MAAAVVPEGAHPGVPAGRPAPAPVRALAVTSGKGGVGKTVVTANLAVALDALGRRVMVLDADLALANVDKLLGLQPRYTLRDVLEGRRRLDEIISAGPGGVRIVPGASGVSRMAGLTPAEHAAVVRSFSDLDAGLDVLLIDTAAGISEGVVRFAAAAQEVLVVVCDEPASIADAYALIRLLATEHGVGRFHVVANMVRTVAQGRDVFTELARRAYRELDLTLDYLGAIPYDYALRRAIKRQRAVLEACPRSDAAHAFRRLARRADRLPSAARPLGRLEFFVERLVGAETATPGL